MQAQWAAVLDQGTIPTSLLVLTNKNFPPLDSVLFMECQLHTMKIKCLIFETHEPHACSCHSKYTSIRTHIEI